ncbi:MAG: preprotein translocase subunit SecE [Candidatus Harrisonbacteria bacterium RIFCSPLOWO2_02_FULL_41_11]|uniref:Protein translocase subunit SecE n=1 Tax=Candidatus Harrisonbacteria bacterium RIFCSPHIGHO2_02_FULL_42_16 TaxID=1798404 RepID=A0A1G1ZK58_9BACT|nr:MAG: preprotein translocase subunit SecE [Candidatus Harrisonbacteria bacterium RIFCSPHIGHO2_02_FULL_42_16]OGY66632.1 MAG: preprotein translocase subunit SecE [Candidatus Harrisonbacteria bacterium RIFCSPLOWO2_02_FULL_41_11]
MFSKLISFLQESKQELSRVNWPSRQETVRLTAIVIFISLLIAAFLGVLDSLFSYLLEKILL